MIERFEVMTKDARRPEGERIIFCDGTGGAWFHAETDLELSHWRPNRTPPEYRAGTSTEICFKFLDAPRPGSWTVAVNNHVDVDGVLSVYALVQSENALHRRETLIAAAEMGDFWEWGDAVAQRVFQGVTGAMRQAAAAREVYQECFDRLPGLIDGTDPACDDLDESLGPLRRGVDLIERGLISRDLIGERCATMSCRPPSWAKTSRPPCTCPASMKLCRTRRCCGLKRGRFGTASA